MNSKPLLGIALAYISGVLWSRHFPAALPAIGVIAIVTLLTAARYRSLRGCAAALLIATSGALHYSARFLQIPNSDLRNLCGVREQLAEVQGILMERPTIREFPSRTRTNYHSTALVRVTAIKRNDWEPASGDVMTSTSGRLDERFAAGQPVQLSGVLRLPPGPAAEGLFDYAAYLFHQRVFYQLRLQSPADWQITGALLQPSLRDRFQEWSRAQLSKGVPDDENLKLIKAMTLGWKSAIEGDVSDAFLRTGTMHIFAISGLHVACIAGALVAGFKVLGFGRQTSAWLVIPLLWFYTIVTGWQSSGVRAAIMATVVIWGWILKRPSNLLNSTAAAALIILAFQPEQLFQAGFQLSFIVVLSLVLLLPFFDERINKFLEPDPFLPSDLRPAWRRPLDKPLRWLLVSIAVSVCSWIGSLAVVLWYFNIVTPAGLVANLVAVPLSSLSLTMSMLSLIFPWASSIFNYLAWACMMETVAVVHWFSEFRWACFHFARPDLALCFLYYSLLICGALLLARRSRVRWWAFASLGLAAVLWMLFGIEIRPPTQITVLASSGTPVFIDRPGSKSDLLVDCSNLRDGKYILKRFLHARGIDSVANALVTHGDINHAGGYEIILREFTPRSFFTSPARARSPVYRTMLGELEGQGDSWTKVARGDNAAGWEVLHPSLDSEFTRADDNAVVLRSAIDGWRILLLSDLGSKGQSDLIENATDLTADVLIAGMPDHDEPFSEVLLERINPKVIVLGRNDAGGFGTSERRVLERITGTGRTIFRTSTDQSISIRVTPETLEFRTMSGKTKQFKKSRLP